MTSSSYASIRCTYLKIFCSEEGSLYHSLECQRCIMPLRQWPLEVMLGDSDGWRLLPSVVPPGLIGTSWLSELHCGSLGFLRCQLWPYTLQRHLDERVSWVCVSEVGAGVGGLMCGNSRSIRTRSALHTHTHTPHRHTVNSHPHLPDVHTPNQPSSLTSVHPCVSNWNMNGFSLGWNRIGLLLLLTGLASLPTDCPHGYSCCHNTPATSAKSTKL